MIIVSRISGEALNREWAEHNIDSHVKIICGQEYGSKAGHIQYTANVKFPGVKILMSDDAPEEKIAAKSNGALFYPLNPGYQKDSWELSYKEGIDCFFLWSVRRR
jgi:hypothetical protein